MNGKIFRIKEQMTYRREVIKFWKIPIGYNSIPTLGRIKIGDKLDIQCDEKNPSKGKILNNNGSITI